MKKGLVNNLRFGYKIPSKSEKANTSGKTCFDPESLFVVVGTAQCAVLV